MNKPTKIRVIDKQLASAIGSGAFMFSRVQKLLSQGADPNCVTSPPMAKGYPSITTFDKHVAIGALAVIRLMLDHGADVKMVRQETLIEVVRNGWFEVFELLLRAGARVGREKSAILKAAEVTARRWPSEASATARELCAAAVIVQCEKLEPTAIDLLLTVARALGKTPIETQDAELRQAFLETLAATTKMKASTPKNL